MKHKEGGESRARAAPYRVDQSGHAHCAKARRSCAALARDRASGEN
jgi:hypothetical protein